MGGIELKPIAPSNKAFNISYLKLYTEIYTEKKTLPTYLNNIQLLLFIVKSITYKNS
jgi:hypothetical protein